MIPGLHKRCPFCVFSVHVINDEEGRAFLAQDMGKHLARAHRSQVETLRRLKEQDEDYAPIPVRGAIGYAYGGFIR